MISKQLGFKPREGMSFEDIKRLKEIAERKFKPYAAKRVIPIEVIQESQQSKVEKLFEEARQTHLKEGICVLTDTEAWAAVGSKRVQRTFNEDNEFEDRIINEAYADMKWRIRNGESESLEMTPCLNLYTSPQDEALDPTKKAPRLTLDQRLTAPPQEARRQLKRTLDMRYVVMAPQGGTDGKSTLERRPNRHQLYCKCRQSYIQKDKMIRCEGSCNDWYHPKCIGMSEKAFQDYDKDRNKSYLCASCKILDE